MSDEEFFAFLSACRSELDEKQSRFQRQIQGRSQWQYNLEDCSLTFGDLTFPITPIGTHSAEHRSWLWAWANEEFPPHARDASRQIQALQGVTGFRVFTDPGIGASSLDAQDFTAMAVHKLEAIGFFRSSSDGPTLYLAVHTPP
jgi:hypothetical protein